ncbi:MAG: SDR family oxidoreductase [Bacteroidota bacterium]
MNISLKNKIALVGGSSGGIGRAIAKQLAACGASVTLMARDEAKLNLVKNELPVSAGQKHRILIADFNRHEDFKEKVQDYFASNSVDILVNNTNGPQAGNIGQKNLNDYQNAFDLLFQNNCFTTLQALPYMKANNFGRVINVSSLTVKEPLANLVLSNTMRSAWLSWNKSLSQDVAADGITVNTILTGLFDTERITSLTKTEAEKTGKTFQDILNKRIAQIPAGRLGKPEEYGYLVAFLASEYASFLTGSNIPLDGGMYKGF